MSSLVEARKVWEEVERAKARGQASVLVEVVGVVGSAYRRPGALMMMAADGRMWGTISGGCLEGDVFIRAEGILAGRCGPILVDYDLSEEEMWSLGIGCKGQIQVWVRRVDDEMPERALLASGGVVTAALPSGPLMAWKPEDPLPADAGWAARIEAAWAGDEPRVLDGTYVRAWRPAVELVIAGAGHDAISVAELARRADFLVTVVDPRPEFNDDRRFPECRHVVGEVSGITAEAYPDLVGAYWVVMNHHKDRDRAAIRAALAMRPRYLGALGPWNRTRELLEGIDAGRQAEVRGPVGLDLSADTPDEVAVSIVGELMAHRKGRSGGSLNRATRLHA